MGGLVFLTQNKLCCYPRLFPRASFLRRARRRTRSPSKVATKAANMPPSLFGGHLGSVGSLRLFPGKYMLSLRQFGGHLLFVWPTGQLCHYGGPWASCWPSSLSSVHDHCPSLPFLERPPISLNARRSVRSAKPFSFASATSWLVGTKVNRDRLWSSNVDRHCEGRAIATICVRTICSQRRKG